MRGMMSVRDVANPLCNLIIIIELYAMCTHAYQMLINICNACFSIPTYMRELLYCSAPQKLTNKRILCRSALLLYQFELCVCCNRK